MTGPDNEEQDMESYTTTFTVTQRAENPAAAGRRVASLFETAFRQKFSVIAEETRPMVEEPRKRFLGRRSR